MPERALLFSDPNCPFCYALEERLHALGLAGDVHWCGVQHAPELPVPMRPATAELRAEVEHVRALAPGLALTVPPGKPNTARAIEHAVAALRTDPVAGRRFVRALYGAFWADGHDLSDPDVLADLAREAGLGPLAPGADEAAVAAGWQEAWWQTYAGGVPLLVRRADGRPLVGLTGEDELRAFLRS